MHGDMHDTHGARKRPVNLYHWTIGCIGYIFECWRHAHWTWYIYLVYTLEEEALIIGK